MIKLIVTAGQPDSSAYSRILKQELEALQPGSLPLQQFTTQGGVVDDADISVTVLSVVGHEHEILAKVGVFFTEVVGGCNCHDDPVHSNAYAEMMLAINRQTAEADIKANPAASLCLVSMVLIKVAPGS